MKEDWEIKKLSDLSRYKDAIVSGPFGSNLKVSDYKAYGVPIFRLQNVGKGYFINKDIKYIDEKKAKELKYHSFKSGDLVLAKLGIPVGKTCIVPEEFASGIIVADVVRIRPDKDIVDYKFLEYFLNTDQAVAQLTGNITGATRPRVNLSDVRNIELYLPPLPEQQRIVSILDECFAAIDQAKVNAEKNLQNAKELFESYLQGVFDNQGKGWVEKTLGDIGKVSMCKRIFKKETSNEGEIPFYKIGTFGKEPNAFISSKLYEEYKSKYSYPKKGDILISASGTIGRRVIYDGEPAYFQDSNIVWINNDEKEVLNDFLYFFYCQCDWNPSRGATISRLYNDDLRSIKINFPSIPEQKDFVTNFLKIRIESEKLETLYQKKIAALDELKKSILQKAFQGELKTTLSC